ncbi:MAG: hypothetical protein AAFV98_15210 [Chloroflexota bacterium]
MQITVRSILTRLTIALFLLAMSVSSVLGQEETNAVAEAANSGPGWMIAIVGVGVLVILGLGSAISAQQADEENVSESA